jgi:hypothetical protein
MKRYRIRPGSIADYTKMFGEGLLFFGSLLSIYFFMYIASI